MANPTYTEIQKLESLRKQIFWWRTGATLVVAVVVVGSLLTLNSAVRGLAQSGPVQDEFVAQMSETMKSDIMPSIQSLASQTLTEIQPQIREEFMGLNKRVPELSDATVKELQTLQEDLPKSSEKTLNKAFGDILSSREAKIREMYPTVTEEQVKSFLDKLRTSGESQVREANNELFSPHQNALASIMDHMHTISESEAGTVKGQDPTWEMGLAVLDVVREDMRQANAAADTKAKTSDGSGDGAKTEVKK